MLALTVLYHGSLEMRHGLCSERHATLSGIAHNMEPVMAHDSIIHALQIIFQMHDQPILQNKFEAPYPPSAIIKSMHIDESVELIKI